MLLTSPETHSWLKNISQNWIQKQSCKLSCVPAVEYRELVHQESGNDRSMPDPWVLCWAVFIISVEIDLIHVVKYQQRPERMQGCCGDGKEERLWIKECFTQQSHSNTFKHPFHYENHLSKLSTVSRRAWKAHLIRQTLFGNGKELDLGHVCTLYLQIIGPSSGALELHICIPTSVAWSSVGGSVSINNPSAFFTVLIMNDTALGVVPWFNRRLQKDVGPLIPSLITFSYLAEQNG